MTSIITDVRIWVDRAGAEPAAEPRVILAECGCGGARLGVEYDAYGLTAANGIRLTAALDGFCEFADASALVSRLRVVKSVAEIACVRRAAILADDALDAALALARPGADEGAILAAMMGALYAGGDSPGNPYIIGSGREAMAACQAALRPGRPLGEVFAAHARVVDAAGMRALRLNACGSSLGTTFAPNRMDWSMIYADNEVIIAPGMVFFLHMILMDTAAGLAMMPGETVLVTDGGCERLSRHGLELRA